MTHVPRKSSSSQKPCQVLLRLFQVEGQEQNPGSCDLHCTVSRVLWSQELYCSGCILQKSSLRLDSEQGWSPWVPLELSDAELPCTAQQCDMHHSRDCTEPCWKFFRPLLLISSPKLSSCLLCQLGGGTSGGASLPQQRPIPPELLPAQSPPGSFWCRCGHQRITHTHKSLQKSFLCLTSERNPSRGSLIPSRRCLGEMQGDNPVLVEDTFILH